MRNHLKTSLGICKCGNGHNWIWAKLPLVELSQVTPGGDHLQLIFVETNTIVFGRNYIGFELSQVTARGSPLTYLCRDRHDCIWTKLPWVEFS